MFDEVRRWMHRNARGVELALWRCLFEGGAAAEVADALLAYQNDDGGFGHALEPDCWNPASTPVATWTAVKYMLWAGFTDQTHPAYRGVWRYLASGKDREDYGWRFSVPGNDAWPHAPWWGYSEAENLRCWPNVTVGFTAFVLRYGEGQEALLRQAEADAQRLMARLADEGAAGEALECLDDLLQAMRLRGVRIPDGAEELVHRRQHEAIGRDAAQWHTYVPRPSRFIHGPDSPLYVANAELVQREVAFLRETREKGGVWPITWTWFDTMDRYGGEFRISENWWKAVVAIENMLFLRAFGGMEDVR